VNRMTIISELATNSLPVRCLRKKSTGTLLKSLLEISCKFDWFDLRRPCSVAWKCRMKTATLDDTKDCVSNATVNTSFLEWF